MKKISKLSYLNDLELTQFGTIRHTDIKILKNTNPNCLKSTQFEKELCTIYLVLYRTWVFFPSWIWKRNEGMTRFKETKDTFETSTLQYNIMKSPYIGETGNFVKSQFSEWNVQMPQYLQILFQASQPHLGLSCHENRTFFGSKPWLKKILYFHILK